MDDCIVKGNTEGVAKICLKDKFVGYCGIEVVSKGDYEAKVGAQIQPFHLNGAGTVQGGFLFTVADYAFAILTNKPNIITVSQSCNMTFVSAVSSGYITATAREIARSSRNCVVEVILREDNGSVIAVANINGFIKTIL